jgi:hypothetical protein
MKRKDKSIIEAGSPVISRVNRSKADASQFYDRISRTYDWTGGLFERSSALKTLGKLNLQNGERVLDLPSRNFVTRKSISRQNRF